MSYNVSKSDYDFGEMPVFLRGELMLELNGKRLCDYCFTTVEGEVCDHCKKEIDRAPCALPLGSILVGRYIVGCVLGKGGFGITYLAYDYKINRRIVIKEFFPSDVVFRSAGDTKTQITSSSHTKQFEDGKEKFYKEAELLAQFVNVPNIVKVYEFFYENNTAYFTMEYLDGCDLGKYVREHGGRISEKETSRIFYSLAQTLNPVHSINVLHRDISPDNIFMCNNGEVKLLDFGAARHLISEHSNSLSVILKMGFAPLEQYQRNGKQGPWTDIYALGATMYVCVTGLTFPEAAARVENRNLDFPTNVGVSDMMKDVIRKMTAVYPQERYQDVRVVASDLGCIMRSYGVETPAAEAPKPSTQRANTNIRAEMPVPVPRSSHPKFMQGDMVDEYARIVGTAWAFDAERYVRYGGAGERFGALVLDTLILSTINIMLLAMARFESWGVFLCLAVSFFYYGLLIGLTGSTVGMKAVRLCVVDGNGARIGTGKAMLRALSMMLSQMILFIGYFFIFSSPSNQTMHDRMTGTYVVKPAATVSQATPVSPGAGGGWQNGGDYAGGAALVALRGPLKGKSFKVSESGVMIGRDSTCCQVLFNNEAHGISRRHCTLRYESVSGRFVLCDQGSKFGTFTSGGFQLPVNQEVVLTSGQRFFLAVPEYTFEVRA